MIFSESKIKSDIVELNAPKSNRKKRFDSNMRISKDLINNVKGFLDEDEGRCLYETALEAVFLGPCLEIGSYCGKSTLYLGAACKENNGILFSIDHHRGSEEQQPGHQQRVVTDPEQPFPPVEVDEGFAVLGMSKRVQHSGKRPWPSRPIQVGRYVKPRLALKENLLDDKTFLLDRSRHLGIQRRDRGGARVEK